METEEIESYAYDELYTEVVYGSCGAQTPIQIDMSEGRSLYELWLDIREKKELKLLRDLTAKKFSFVTGPTENTLPYIESSDPIFDGASNDYFVYGALIEGCGWQPYQARELRDFLFKELPMVRMAYLLPTQDGVYLIADGHYRPGDTADLRCETITNAFSILSSCITTLMLYKYHTGYFHICPCLWSYVSADESACFRPRFDWSFEDASKTYNRMSDKMKTINRKMVDILIEKEENDK